MIDTIIFDFGGVLIDWNPCYLYQKLFKDEKEMMHFLTTVCTPDWNEEQDAGRSLKDGTDLLITQFPDMAENIRAYYGRWEEMLGGTIDGTVTILQQLKHNYDYKLYGLTNWSAETFPIALKRYEFLNLFDGILVSGTEKLRKPNPKFYQLLTDRFNIIKANSIFIDDNQRNVDAANRFGLPAITFQSAEKLKTDLQKLGIL